MTNRCYENIILITADSLRADYCGFINKERKHLTPFLNKLARDSLVFKNAYANAPYTPMSFPAIFTGKYPIFMGSPRVGVRITLPEFLRLNKYKTMAFVASNPYAVYFSGGSKRFDIFKIYPSLEEADSHDPHVMKSFVSSLLSYLTQRQGAKTLAKNFRKVLLTLFPRNKRGIIGALVLTCTDIALMKLLKLKYPLFDMINGSTLNDVVVNSLRREHKENKNNFFIWVHYMSTHFPYDAPEYDPTELLFRDYMCNYKLIKQKEGWFLNRKALQKHYSNGVRALDNHIKNLIESLEELDLLEDAIVIFTSDHGEELFEGGNYGHGGYLRKEVLHVPLVIYGIDERGERSDLVSHIDIFPTIGNLLSKNKTTKKILNLLDGKNLIEIQPHSNSRVIISESITRTKEIIKKSPNKYPEPDEEVFFRIIRGERISIPKILGDTIELNLMLTFSRDNGKVDTLDLTITSPQEVEKVLSNNNDDLIRCLAFRAKRILDTKYDLPIATRFSILRRALGLFK